MTLIELLIVIVILTTLVAAAIPLMAPTSDARRVREAARDLNTFIGTTQNKAVRQGRPYGIYLKRLSEDTGDPAANGMCIEVYEVEQPAPFPGFDETSRIMLALDNGPTGGAGQVIVRFVARGSADPPATDSLPLGWDNDPIPPYIFRPGDVIEIGRLRCVLIDTSIDPVSGFYNQQSGTPDGRLVAKPLNDTGQMLQVVYDNTGARLPAIMPRPPANPPPIHYWTEPMPYRILRQPMLTSTEPFQLPRGTAIDLAGSGAPVRVTQPGAGLPVMTGAFHTPPTAPNTYDVENPIDNRDGVIIMFTPEGSIERLRITLTPGESRRFDEPVTDNLYLLVGLSGNIPLQNPDFRDAYTAVASEADRERVRSQFNWLHLDSQWVVINSQGGNVATVENAAAYVNPIEQSILGVPALPAQRRANEINNAREFAREMTRTGGR